jgi:hypothetical protein
MGRLLLLGLALLAARRFLARRSVPDEQVTVGWEDGSSVTLEPGTPERDRLVELARGALRG